MKEYIEVSTGKTVKEDDFFRFKKTERGENFLKESSYILNLTPGIIKILLKNNIIKEKTEEKKELNKDELFNKVITNLSSRINNYANFKKLNIDYKSLFYILNDLFPKEFFAILLKRIAVELDKKYENHIVEAEKHFIINIGNGKIYPLTSKEYLNNYTNFAIFRSVEDANIAIELLRPLYNKLFNEQENKKCHKEEQ